MWISESEVANGPAPNSAVLHREADDALVAALKKVAVLAYFDPRNPQLVQKVRAALSAMDVLRAALRTGIADSAGEAT